jgi:protein disulfide-isomerase-like protein
MYDGQTDVLSLDASSFDQHVGGDQPAFVEFYAPWCGHCKHLTPEFEKLATSAKGQSVKIVAVDADKHRDLGSRFGVSGFPTLKYFPAHSTEGEAYSGGRTAKDIATFINGKAGTNIRIKEAPTAVTVLTDSTFDAVVSNPTKHVLVEFYAPWCGHCKKLAPDYEKLAKIFHSEPDIIIANLDATEHPQAASKYGVSGYPTIKWFPKDSKDGVDYNSGRSLEDFVKFINDNTGTERNSDGSFLETAGRIPELDELVERFLKHPKERPGVLAEVEAKIASLGTHKNLDFAKFYRVNMKRIIEKGDTFAHEELERLERMLGSGNVAPSKFGEFSKRINIARLFKAVLP